MNENEIGTMIIGTSINIHIKLDYLINFNEALLKHGITRIINGKL